MRLNKLDVTDKYKEDFRMKLRFLAWEQDIKSRFDHEFHFRWIKLDMSMRCSVREVY